MNTAPLLPMAVQTTPELRRVLALPRRTWTEEEGRELAARMSALLKTPQGTQTLRPIQAIALCEAATQTGLFAPIRVGGGKTLISALLPVVCQARRVVLLLPAKLIEKTRREFRALAEHWHIDVGAFELVSYELLGREQHADLLERLAPDLMICDEAHRLKNPRAAVTRRVLRYSMAHHDVKLVVMSGTVTKRSLNDYAHLLQRCLVDCPVPRSRAEVGEWADAVDEKTGGEARIGTGALRMFCSPDELELHAIDPLTACRRALRRRLVETSGVVATTESYSGASLLIRGLQPTLGPAVDAAFRRLRGAWELPDGTQLADAIALWRHARELALGFFYRWDPAPPREWLDARKAWASACRYILTNNRRDLDSELQVARFLDGILRRGAKEVLRSGMYAQGLEALEAWREVKDTFRPNTVPVWLDHGALEAAKAWGNMARQGPRGGIIWTEHTAFAEELSRRTRWSYYGKKGLDARGRTIESDEGSTTIIASIASNSEGRNLQAWCKGLVVSPPANGQACEQLIGRFQRPGQLADEVQWDIFFTCREHVQALKQARADARYIEHSTGQAQHLAYADYDVPEDERCFR